MKKKCTIAIIEHDVLFASKFKQEFDNNGFSTHIISSCGRINEFLKSIEPSLIVCDMNFPEETVCNFIEEIREDIFYNLIPIVVLTGTHLNDDQIDKILHLGVSGLFFKPLKFEMFNKSIDQILNKQKNYEAEELWLELLRYTFKIFNNIFYWVMSKKSC
jgi:DNA-binding NtrC family response regulator